MAADLTLTEQKHVRTALLHLRNQIGAWKPLAAALGFEYGTVEKVANDRGRAVTPTMAFRVARFAGVSIDELLEGQFIPGACPRCGHKPDFADESTIKDRPIVAESQNEPAKQNGQRWPKSADYSGLRLVK